MRAPHANGRIRIIEFHNCETFRLDNVTTSTMLICNQKRKHAHQVYIITLICKLLCLTL